MLPVIWLVLAVACADGSTDSATPSPTPTVTSTAAPGSPMGDAGGATPELSLERITVDRPGVSIDLAFPQLRGGASAEVLDRINGTLRSWAEERRDEFLAEIEGMDAGAGSPAPGLGTATDVRDQWTGPGIISFLLEEQIYLGGASTTGDAHGFTFDLTTGARLTLEDLLRPGASEELTERVVEELADRDDTASRSALEDAVTVEAMDAFLVSSSGLTVLFDQYVVAAGALGLVTVELGPERLEDLVRPEGPLAAVLG